MAPLNNKYINAMYIAFVLLTFSVLGYYLLFKKQKEYYTIKNVKVRAVQVMGNSVGGYTIIPFQRESKKIAWGVSVELSKEYVSGENSVRQLFGGSMEPGISGIQSKINHFNIVLKKGDNTVILNDSLFAKIYNSMDSITLSSDKLEMYSRGITLAQFIEDINNNMEYTKGISFDDSEIYFWFNTSADNNMNLSNSRLFVDIQAEGLYINKPLIEK
jgi:hypothetical protein